MKYLLTVLLITIAVQTQALEYIPGTQKLIKLNECIGTFICKGSVEYREKRKDIFCNATPQGLCPEADKCLLEHKKHTSTHLHAKLSIEERPLAARTAQEEFDYSKIPTKTGREPIDIFPEPVKKIDLADRRAAELRLRGEQTREDGNQPNNSNSTTPSSSSSSSSQVTTQTPEQIIADYNLSVEDDENKREEEIAKRREEYKRQQEQDKIVKDWVREEEAQVLKKELRLLVDTGLSIGRLPATIDPENKRQQVINAFADIDTRVIENFSYGKKDPRFSSIEEYQSVKALTTAILNLAGDLAESAKKATGSAKELQLKTARSLFMLGFHIVQGSSLKRSEAFAKRLKENISSIPGDLRTLASLTWDAMKNPSKAMDAIAELYRTFKSDEFFEELNSIIDNKYTEFKKIPALQTDKMDKMIGTIMADVVTVLVGTKGSRAAINSLSSAMKKSTLGRAIQTTMWETRYYGKDVARTVGKALGTRDFSVINKVIDSAGKIRVKPEILSKAYKEASLVDDAIKTQAITRAQKFKANWSNADISESITKLVGRSPKISTTKSGKILYTGENGIQIVHDYNGKYFRIEKTTVAGKRRYLDLDGLVPNNKTLPDGRVVGRSKVEYEAATHFLLE